MAKKTKKKTTRKTLEAKKMHELNTKGVRYNTHKPVSKSNPRRKIPHKQQVAIMLSMKRRGKL